MRDEWMRATCLGGTLGHGESFRYWPAVEPVDGSFGGSVSFGGVRSCGAPGSRKSMTVFACASRSVSAGRFHLCSIVARIEVWSCGSLVTPLGLACGEATTAGTRTPYLS